MKGAAAATVEAVLRKFRRESRVVLVMCQQIYIVIEPREAKTCCCARVVCPIIIPTPERRKYSIANQAAPLDQAR